MARAKRALPARLAACLVAAMLAGCGGGSGGRDPGATDVAVEATDAAIEAADEAVEAGDLGPTDLPGDPGPRDDDGGADAVGDAGDLPGDVKADLPADVPGDAGPVVQATVLLDRARIGSNGSEPNFQHAGATFTKGADAAFAVRLVLDLDTSCYPFEKWASNPPPAGQNWPADCDAFDRNFEFLVDEPAAEGEPPATEWVRAITPFGGPMRVEADVTDLYNGLATGEHDAHVRISTWSDGAGQVSGSNGGWWISARLEVTPGVAPRAVRAVIPLWNGVLGAGPAPAAIPFTVPEGVAAGRIEYRATGHGGAQGDGQCSGPAEEFCQRTQTLKVDDALAGQRVLWSDCSKNCVPTQYGDPETTGFVYCLKNPTGHTMSAIADRANWCPSEVTPPWVVDGPALAVPGPHAFAFDVANVAAGGSWRISAVYVGLGGP